MTPEQYNEVLDRLAMAEEIMTRMSHRQHDYAAKRAELEETMETNHRVIADQLIALQAQISENAQVVARLSKIQNENAHAGLRLDEKVERLQRHLEVLIDVTDGIIRDNAKRKRKK